MFKVSHIILYSITALTLFSCALYKPRYRDAKNINSALPKAEVATTFFLVGDAGYAKKDSTTRALKALNTYLAAYSGRKDYTIFLGDNIYPQGMPKKDHEDRMISEHRLDVQVSSVKDFDGEIIFIPGNHDWYNQGLKGLERQEKYLEKALKDKHLFHPTNGCALESIEVNEYVQLIIFDSQWYLENWDKHPTINDDCPQMKTREAVFTEIESEFKKNQNKRILFVQHHPLYTNGVHGGQYAPVKHIYPSQKKIPLPGLASLAVLARTAGGVSSQDTQNKQYKSLVQRITTLANQYDNIVFASGHEHSLQYIEEQNIKQIVSGSGSKNSYATLSNNGLFAYGEQGFAQLDIYKNGAAWVSFYSIENAAPKLVYRKEIIPQKKPYEWKADKVSYPSTVKAAIYEGDVTSKDINKSLWRSHYRTLYYTPVEAKVALLDTLYGGLEVMRAGGGHQTESIRLKDRTGKEYNMRLLKKNASQFLQSTLFKNRVLDDKLEKTTIEKWLDDIYTAAHPYGFLAIPQLAEAVDVRYTNPKLFFIPKQKTLGKYNETHGNALYMIVERPEEHHIHNPSFGKPNDIESTADVYERLRRDEKYKIDEPSYIRARLFDMLIGDWDRHADQWRWAEYELENGDHIFKPIPRDRDQVFSNFDGALFDGLRKTLAFTKQFQKFGPEIINVKWLNASGNVLDRTLIKNATIEDWLKEANFIEKNLTDEIINNAFKTLPNEISDEKNKKLISNLKSRKKQLSKTAEAYYNYLSKLVIVSATDKDDFIHIIRLPEGKTRVTISRIKDGKKADIVSDRTYDKALTKEIWIYALDDDDVIEVDGQGKNLIKIKVIGGQNNDIYRIKNGKNITLYDYASKPNTIEKLGGARKVFTDRYQVNHYNQHNAYRSTYSILPAIGFNPDDGVKIGLTNTITTNGFFRNPFTTRHNFKLGYFFATQGWATEYLGEFAGVLGDYNLLVGATFNTPNFAENFFGIGNGSINNDDDSNVDFDFNRVKISTIAAKFGAQKRGRFGSNLTYTANLEGIQVENTTGRFINQRFSSDSPIFDRQWFIGLNIKYNYESYDVKANPTRGMRFQIEGGNRWNTNSTSRHFGFVKSHLGFYNALSRNRKWVLKTSARSVFNINDDFEFYQSAQIGGHGLLRGYRNQRFSGKTALSGSADIRYSFDSFNTKFLPLQLGILAGTGAGRVYSDLPESNTWHADYGIGFWVNSLDVVNGTFHLFSGEDGPRVSFDFLFNF